MKLLADTFTRLFGEGFTAEQAELLNMLGLALWNGCKRNYPDFDRQLCFMESELDEHGRRLARGLGEFVSSTETKT